MTNTAATLKILKQKLRSYQRLTNKTEMDRYVIAGLKLDIADLEAEAG